MSNIKLGKFRLRNFCQHENLEIDLSPGIVVVVGSNGDGKSNAADALAMGMVRKTITGASREELLTWGQKTGGVEWEFEADNHEYTMNVKLPTGVVLERDNEDQPVARSEAAVSKIMTDIYGASYDQVLDTVFQDQTQVLKFIYLTPTERGKLLQSWFRMKELKKAPEDILRVLATIPEPLSRAADIEEVCHQREAHASDILQHTETLGRLQADADARRSGWQAAVATCTRPVSGAVEQARIQKQAALAKANARKQEVAGRKPGVVDKPPARTGAYVRGEDCQRKCDLRRQKEDSVLRAQVDLKTAETDLQTLNGQRPPELPPEKREKLRATEQWVVDEGPAYKMFKERVCPTCGHAYSDITPEEMDERVADYERVLPQLEAMRAEAQKHDAPLAVWNRKHAAATGVVESRRRSVETETANRDAIKLDPGFDEQVFSTILLKEGAWSSYSSTLSRWEADNANAAVDVANAETALRGLSTDGTVTQAEHDSAQEVVDGWQTLETEIRRVGNSLVVARERLSVAEARDRDIRLQMERDKVVLAQRQAVTRLRSLLQWDGIPASVVRTNLQRFNKKLGQVLSDLGCQFTARITVDFELVFDKPDNGAWGKSCIRLSGGEKMFLAQAIRVTQSLIVGGSIPLIEMDEPTSWVSADNMDNLLNFFGRLRELVGKRICVLVITHERKMLSICDRVIDLSPEGNGPHQV